MQKYIVAYHMQEEGLNDSLQSAHEILEDSLSIQMLAFKEKYQFFSPLISPLAARVDAINFLYAYIFDMHLQGKHAKARGVGSDVLLFLNNDNWEDLSVIVRQCGKSNTFAEADALDNLLLQIQPELHIEREAMYSMLDQFGHEKIEEILAKYQSFYNTVTLEQAKADAITIIRAYIVSFLALQPSDVDVKLFEELIYGALFVSDDFVYGGWKGVAQFLHTLGSIDAPEMDQLAILLDPTLQDRPVEVMYVNDEENFQDQEK